MDNEEQFNQDKETTSNNLVRLDEIAERVSRQQIREMADIYRLSEDDLEDKKIIYPQMRDKRVLNIFRDLRTKLMAQSGKRNFTMLITSICEGGGSTFVTRNLAASFALDHGKTAVIVDCNLGSPASDHLIEGADIGFSDFLENPSVTVDEIIYATGIPRLRLIPAGQATEIGPEYYTSYRTKQFVEEITSRYTDRYVFLDAPPIGDTADARILSELCDYVVIVVPYGLVTQDQIAVAIESIQPEKLAGLVFNN